MADLLLELGTEELPARFIDPALAALRSAAEQDLAEVALAPREVGTAGTPRRLTLWATGLPAQQPERVEERFGPAREAALKDGKPTQAGLKFAESLGLPFERLEYRPKPAQGGKGGAAREHLYARRQVPGRSALEVLAERIPTWIERIPFAKSMRWVPHERLRFGRPLRRIACLLGEGASAEVVPVAWAGVSAGREVEGHRFLHRAPLVLEGASFAAYRDALRRAHVIVEPAERRALIVEGLRPHLGDAGLERHAALVDEVRHLVEWPVVDAGRFDPRFLQLPAIVVVRAMTGHQRYFPILGGDGRVEPRFAYVANRPAHPVIRDGNQRVLAARLSDALFFFQTDQETPLTDRVEALSEIVFMDVLGSYRDRIPRVGELALEVARAAGLAPETARLPDSGLKVTRSLGPGGRLPVDIHLAAQLQRADLSTEVVGEFPELQGEMGAIYARLQGQSGEVAEAIREAYLPRGEGDALPATPVGICLALADKLDTIAAAWATGKKPTGSKDPFMVRRNTLGVLRILKERALDLGCERLLRRALEQLPPSLRKAEHLPELLAYFRERLEVQAVKGEGRDVDRARQALAAGADPSNVLDFWRRLDALDELARDARWGKLCELVLRTKQITRKNGPDVDPNDVDAARLDHPAERALAAALGACREPIRAAIAGRRYVDAGQRYVEALADLVHTFMEPAPKGVFVMDEDPRLRTNRLALLKQVHGLLAEGFADLAERG